MEIDAVTLPETTRDLKEIIVELHRQIGDLRDDYDKETGILNDCWVDFSSQHHSLHHPTVVIS